MPNLFLTLQKADLAKRQVWGFAAVEQPDNATPPEIMDYEKSKPHFEAWSQTVQKASQGKSLGNVRAMHGAKCWPNPLSKTRSPIRWIKPLRWSFIRAAWPAPKA